MNHDDSNLERAHLASLVVGVALCFSVAARTAAGDPISIPLKSEHWDETAAETRSSLFPLEIAIDLDALRRGELQLAPPGSTGPMVSKQGERSEQSVSVVRTAVQGVGRDS